MVPYVLRSFRSGISDEDDKGLPGSFKFGYGLDIHSRADVLKAGSAAATIFDTTTGETGSGSTKRGTTLNSHFNVILPASDGSTYMFGATGSIFAMSPDGFITNVYNEEENIIGAGEFGISSGERFLFWGKSTSIARRPLQGYSGVDPARDSGQGLWADATQAWKTEYISSSAVWRTMVNASGSFMMANNEGLSVLDFDGNFDPLKLNIRPGNKVNALEERDDYVILGTEKDDDGEEGHLWAWIVTALNFVQKKRLPAFGVNALITAETPLAQAGDQGEIFPADFENSVPLTAIPGGGKAQPHGVTVHEDLATFGMYGGTYPGLWTLGRRNRNRGNALNYQYRLSPTVGGSTVATIGAIAVINGTLLASWGTNETGSSSYGLDAISSTTKANALFEGLEFDKGGAWDERMVDTVHATFSPLVSGTSFSIKYKADKESSWRYAVFAGGATTFSQADETEAIATLGGKFHILEPGLEINSSGSNTSEIHELAFYLANQQQKT